MRANIELTADRRVVAAWLAEMYDGPPDDPAPDPAEWFASRVRDLAADELSVATMFSPLNVGTVKIA